MFLLTLKNKREEGVYAVDDQYGNLVLFLFEEEDDATRYAMMLEEDEQKEMVVVEIDPILIELLHSREDFSGLKIINSDILTQQIDSLPINNPVRIVGNIPYNITSPIISG